MTDQNDKNDTQKSSTPSNGGGIHDNTAPVGVGSHIAQASGSGAHASVTHTEHHHYADDQYDVRGLENPYLGLAAFTYDEREKYAGRERVVAHAVDLLTTPGDQRTLLFITGASGSGKSSFAQAGLLPALEQHYQQRHHTVRHTVFRPSKQPVAMLADALLQLGMPAVKLNASPATLYEHIQVHTPDQAINVIVIDQFEELFTQSESGQRDTFFTLLTTLPSFGDLHIHLVATIRADYLPELFAHKALYDEAKRGIDLRVMTEDELKQAIQHPVQQYPDAKGKHFESALLDKLATDAAGNAAYLPLLQVTLDDLWKRGWLKLSAYGTLTDAIQQRAEQVYTWRDFDGVQQECRTHEEQVLLLDLLLDFVVSGSGSDDAAHRDVRRRRPLVALQSDDPQRARLIDDLVRARLLSTSRQPSAAGEEEVVDIIHESLLSRWERLKEAIDAKREMLQQREHFEQALREWLKHGRDAKYLLMGVRLSEAQALNDRGDVALRTAEAQDLLWRSAKQQEAREHQLRTTLNRSESQRLAFAAREQFHDFPEVALLLAEQAVSRHHSAETEQALRDLLTRVQWQPIVCSGHQRQVIHATFAPDSQSVLTASADGTVRLWDSYGTGIRDFSGHEGVVWRARFSPDGQYIITASSDFTVRLWAAANGHTSQTLIHPNDVRDAHFSPDGQYILTWTRDGTTILWDFTGRQLQQYRGGQAQFLPDGSGVVTVLPDFSVRVYSLTGEQVVTLIGHQAEITSVVIDPTSERILTTSRDRTARLYHRNGNLQSVLRGHRYDVLSAAFDPNGQTIATASGDRTARLWSLDGSVLATCEDHTSEIFQVQFSPDGQYILTCSGDTTARLWRRDGTQVYALSGHTDIVANATHSPDGQHIVTASYDTTARLWHPTCAECPTIRGHTDWVFSAVYSPDGQRILTASFDGTAQLWDRNGGLLQVFSGHQAPVWHAIFSKDGQYVLTGSADGKARMWGLNGRQLVVYDGHSDKVLHVALSSDGQYIVTASADGTARLWDLSGTLLRVFQGHRSWVHGAAFSPDGNVVVTASVDRDRMVTLWDLHSGRPITRLIGHEKGVNAAQFSPDGQYLVTASYDRTARVWTRDGVHQQTLVGHLGWVYHAEFSPDGNFILTSSEDRTARIWTHDGRPTATLSGHTELVYRATFSPDQRRIITASQDNTARQHWFAIDELLLSLRARVGRTLTEEEVQRFSLDGTR
jgi:WD40 repeat protein